MAYVLTDEQLELICERSGCDCECIKCPAFAANRRYHFGYEEEDDDDYWE